MDTAQQIVDRVLVRLEDPDQRFYTTSDLVSLYNEALDELAEFTEANENYVTVKRRLYAPYIDLRGYLPPDALRVTAVWNMNTSRWLAPTTTRELDETLGRKWEEKPDDARWWWMRGIYFLGAYPVASDSTSTLRVYYLSLFPHVDEDGGLATGLSTSVRLPPDYASAIEDYMMYSLLVQKKETQKAMQHWARFRDAEQELSNLSKNPLRRNKTFIMGARRGTPVGHRR